MYLEPADNYRYMPHMSEVYVYQYQAPIDLAEEETLRSHIIHIPAINLKVYRRTSQPTPVYDPLLANLVCGVCSCIYVYGASCYFGDISYTRTGDISY